MFKKIITLLISFLLLVSVSSCKKKEELIPTYFHYDDSGLSNQLEKVDEILQKDDYDSLIKIYDYALQELKTIDDLYVLMEFKTDSDINNQEYAQEKQYIYSLVVKYENLFALQFSKLANSKYADKFKEYLNDDITFNGFKDYKVKSQELMDLLNKEDELKEKYESFSIDQLYAEGGQLFVELLAIRDKIAKLSGYDNYNEYADKEIYARTVDKKSLETFYQACKDFTVDYEEYYFFAKNRLPEYKKDVKGLLNDLKKIVNISKLASDEYKFFLDNELYVISDEDNYLDCAYTDVFYSNNVPYIFSRTCNQCLDIQFLAHEFGHFCDLHLDTIPYILFHKESYDLCEIHSTGLTALLNDYYAQVIDDKYSMMACFNIADLISYVVDGCIYDEFQRYIYENPDISIEEINDYYHDLMIEYGYSEDDFDDDRWMLISHNFNAPVYYLSYAASGIASLQLWKLSQTDYDLAVKTWENIVINGAYDKSYDEIVTAAGLATYDNYEAVMSTLTYAYNYCAELYLNYPQE